MGYEIMTSENDSSGYRYRNAEPSRAHAILLPTVLNIIESLNLKGPERRIFDLGCGNGSEADVLSKKDYDVTDVDQSIEGIEQVNRAYPNLKLLQGSAYDNLAERFGQYPVVISLEVVEHTYFSNKFATCVYNLLHEGGTAIISTPYHGYCKNLVLAITGKMDAHFTALGDNAHIKFWSFRTLKLLLLEAGLIVTEFHRVGRIPALAKSMIVVARK